MVEKNEVLYVHFANSASKYKIIVHGRLKMIIALYTGSGAHKR